MLVSLGPLPARDDARRLLLALLTTTLPEHNRLEITPAAELAHGPVLQYGVRCDIWALRSLRKPRYLRYRCVFNLQILLQFS